MFKGHENKKDHYGYIIGVVGALTGLLFGMDIGVIAGALPFLTKEFVLNVEQQGIVVSSILFPAVLGTLFSIPLARKFGRKFSLLICVSIYALGALASALSPSYEFLLISRFFLGISLGIASFNAPLYIAEISPENIRGALISWYQIMINVGIVIAFLSDTILTPGGYWRFMLGFIAIPACIVGLLFLILPRSPRWLVLKKRDDEAKEVLFKILQSKKLVERDYKEILTVTKERISISLKLFKNKKFLHVLLLALTLQMIQQYTGINIFVYYAPSVYKSAGFVTPLGQMLCTLAAGTVNMLVPLVAVKFVDKLGRKPLLYIGLSVIVFGLILGALGMSFIHDQFFAILTMIATFIFIAGFAFSLGPVVWVICSEVFPLKVREVGMMFTTASNWFYTGILGLFFPVLNKKFGTASIMLFFAFIAIFSYFIVYYFVPETKGITLEEIEMNLMSGKKLRNLGKFKTKKSIS